MDQLKFIRESTSSIFHLKVYHGYGYELEIRRFLGEGGGTVIHATPIGDILYQPDLYINENLEITMSFNGIIHVQIDQIDRVLKAINDAVLLSKEIKKRIDQL